MTKKRALAHRVRYPADDRFVRFVFSKMVRMAGLLRFALPREITDLMEFGGLRRLHDQQVGRNLHELRDDLSLECPLKGGRGKIIIRIIFEHKSAHDRKLWFQIVHSCVTQWEATGIAPVIAIILHTGPEPFQFHSPKTVLTDLPEPIRSALLDLKVWAIDLHNYTEESIWQSQDLDNVSKITLNILKLSQLKVLTADNIRRILKNGLPGSTKGRQRRFLEAAMNYIRRKNILTPEDFQQLRDDMSKYWAHPMEPNSYAAYELREERAKGVELDKIEVIQAMLAKGCDWAFIEDITHLNEVAYQALKAKYQN